MSSTAGEDTHSLSESINNSTRSVHAKLNRLVLSRLRLALPPIADDASQYVAGLLHITPIYMALESLWTGILEPPEPGSSSDNDDNDDNDDDDKHKKTSSLLANLHVEGLQRTQALQNDLRSLTGWSDRTLAEKLNHTSECPVLGDFLSHIQRTAAMSPHVLIAYAWVLYMALFSGGRFIRSSLENIYPAFWVPASAQLPRPATLAGSSDSEDNTLPPLSFFRFATSEDGEDLKRTFKERLRCVESVLSEKENEEIVKEAEYIFDRMIRLVEELDGICGTDTEAAEARLLSLRSRDSVVVSKERLRNFAKTGGGGGGGGGAKNSDSKNKAPLATGGSNSSRSGNGRITFG
ncbi:hypothetical protein GGR50DRAFT_262993 [Xylaria sp. CBS 124048]|nr:hypothetical protein GGR50DRAFT_262993 [Xylaria sp. CBS 124048]